MVVTDLDERTGERRIVLRPNASLSRRQMRLLLAFMALLMGGIAAVFVQAGAWLVLPFSGLEWLLLAYCLRLSFRDSSFCEVITITDSLVSVEKGRHKPEQSWRFQRAWVALDLVRPTRRGHPSHLHLRLHGKCVEIGRFLVEDERRALARELRGWLTSR